MTSNGKRLILLVLLASCKSGDSDTSAPSAAGVAIDGDCDEGPAWSSRTLTWRATDAFVQEFGDNGVDGALAAIAIWESAPSGLVISESAIADLEVSAEVGDHGDGYPFDGVGGVAGHAFDGAFGELSGAIHLDADEGWSDGPSFDDDVLDLATILAHEFGHALGLCHVDDPDALMHANYHGRVTELTTADVEALEGLYPAEGDADTDSDADSDTDADTDSDTDTDADCTDADGDGYGEGADCLGTDCDDGNATVHEQAAETSSTDGHDNDCDGITDEIDVPDGVGIDTAFRLAESYDSRVIIVPGTYTPSSNLYVSRSTSTFESAGGGEVVFDLSSAGCLVKVVDGGAVTLTDFEARGGTGCSTGDNGGAIVVAGGSLALDACTLTGNSHDWGGAMWIEGGSVSVTSCEFSDNAATSDGGAVYLYGGSLTISGAVFAENTAGGSGGGLLAEGSSTLLVNNVIFANNYAGGGGGGAKVTNGGSLAQATFVGNDGGGNYGALYSSSDGATVSGAIFYDNGDRAVRISSNYEMAYSLYGASDLYGGSWIDGGGNLSGAAPTFVSYSADGVYNDDLDLVYGSDGQDDGDPSCTDTDGTRCDMGAYGGPDAGELP